MTLKELVETAKPVDIATVSKTMQENSTRYQTNLLKKVQVLEDLAKFYGYTITVQ